MSRPNKDDILAINFLDDDAAWATATLCPYVNPSLVERMNKKLQHLTYARLDMAEEWDVVAVRNDILNGWAAFLEALPQERRAWFE